MVVYSTGGFAGQVLGSCEGGEESEEEAAFDQHLEILLKF